MGSLRAGSQIDTIALSTWWSVVVMPPQAPRGLAAQPPGWAVGPDAGSVERLVGVDVAHSRDHGLVQQQGFQRRPPAPQLAIEVVAGEGGVDGLRAQAREPSLAQQLLL